MSTPEGLARALTLNWAADPDRPRPDPEPAFDGTYCPYCGDLRRMKLRILHWRRSWSPAGEAELETPDAEPSLFSLQCLQCDDTMRVLVNPSGAGTPEVFLIPASWAAPPSAVPGALAYALEQAERAQAIHASSAAVVMYRRALEHLLADQGYERGGLAQRIEAALSTDPRPEWLERLDPDYLALIKGLGNAASHGDGGPAQRQLFDDEAMSQIRLVFAELLGAVYGPSRTKALINGLRSRLSTLRESR